MYKSAYVIVTHLNEGKKINSDEITKIISANAVFEKLLRCFTVQIFI